MSYDLFKNLTADSTVLTVNQRLAASLHAEHARYQTEQSVTSLWPTPDILPLSAWLLRLWQDALSQHTTHPLLLLNPQQELVLWKQIIEQDIQQTEQLLSLNATAKMAKQAWQLTQQWQINLQHNLFTQTDDCRAWQRWALAFKKICTQKFWLDHASLPNQLLEYIQAQPIKLPNQLFLIGFDEINPQYLSLFNTIEALGCKIFYPTSNLAAISGKSIAITNTEAEIYAMANWAATHAATQNIACIVPNLNEIRAQISDIFTEILAPHALLPNHLQETLPFNISAGISFIDFPLIRSAFQLLRLQSIVSLPQLSSLLLSPHLAYAEQEMHERAQLDVYLRQHSEQQLLLHQVLIIAQKRSCPLLAQLFKTFLETQACLSKAASTTKEHKVNGSSYKQSPAEWALYFTELLAALGWPGERTLNSTEYQLHERFKALLNEFCQLDIVLTKIDRLTALEQLQQLAQATLFQPQSKHPAPIQILGVLESSGLHFDQIWVMGLHNQAWPTTATPNAFIPLALQREVKLPHASNERELDFCRTVTHRLLRSASHVICSYPQQNADQHLQISALIKHLPPITLAELELSDSPLLTEKIQQSGELETFNEEYAPPLSQDEAITGGTHIFKLQAACPFRAFAELRLGAVRIEKTSLGLNNRQRGNLLHQTLEIAWKTLQNHTTLINHSKVALDSIINNSIDEALTYFIQKYPLTCKQQFIAIERKRLERLLQQWLTLEKQRPPFSVVAIEKSGEYQLANIHLKLRVDRIDQLADGSYLLIDYKTSQQINFKSWLSERPDEPQLPIYCVTSILPIKGLAFAQLRSNQMQLIGLHETSTGITNIMPVADLKEADIPKDWDSLRAYWHTILEKLGQQFQNGYAKVDPKHQEQTCTYCDLSPLCRVKKLS